MHDITEGGLLGGIWEASRCIDKGIYIEKDSIPVDNITMKICNILNINPLRLISSGSMLIISPVDKVEDILQKLGQNNIQASLIGQVTEKGIKIMENQEIKDIDFLESDELYKVI